METLVREKVLPTRIDWLREAADRETLELRKEAEYSKYDDVLTVDEHIAYMNKKWNLNLK